MRSSVAVIAALLLTAAGCGVTGEDDPTLQAPPPTATTAPPAPGEPPAQDGAGGAGDGAGSPGTTQEPGASPRPTSVPTSEAVVDGSGPPGSFAPVLLQPEPTSRVVLELLVQDRKAPRDSTVEHVASTLRRESANELSLARGTVPGGDRSWSPEELRAAADAASTHRQGGDQAVIRLLFLGGGLEGNERALGAAVRGDTAVVFTDRVEDAAGLLGASELEKAVALHEVGHLLGLVDLYLDTGRQDPEHPGHSTNTESVMYWAVESSLVGQLLSGGPPTTFDAADRRDLARIRNGG